MLKPSLSAFMPSLRKCCASGLQLWLLQICSTRSQAAVWISSVAPPLASLTKAAAVD